MRRESLVPRPLVAFIFAFAIYRLFTLPPHTAEAKPVKAATAHHAVSVAALNTTPLN